MRRLLALIGVGCFSLVGAVAQAEDAPSTPDVSSPTLAAVRDRGHLRCGIIELGVGLSEQSSDGTWIGFYPDFCRALAAAVTGQADHVEMVNLSLANRFAAVQQGAVDVLMSGATWTLGRDADMGISFPALYLFDGQSYMAHVSENIHAIDDLKGKTVCVAKGTTSLLQTQELSNDLHLDLKVEPFETIQGAFAAFFSRQCQAITDDSTSLASTRARSVSDPEDYLILPERVSKEPLSPAVKKGDQNWEDIVRWVVNATIAGEEMGITSGNIDSLVGSTDPTIRRFLGIEPGLGKGLGLEDRWAYRVIKASGNYGEIFDRNLGQGSVLKLDRGINKPWNRGGVLWSPPFR